MKPSPRYVDACVSREWSLALFEKAGAKKGTAQTKRGWWVPSVEWQGEIGKEKRIPFRCSSWRCPSCRDFARRRDFVRIETALQKHDPRAVVFLVLTLDPKKSGGDVWEAFDCLVPRWRVLAKWLKRNHGLQGFVSTVEVHRSGRPHVNVIAVAPGLAKAIRTTRDRKGRRTVHELKRAAVRAGWGWRLTAEIPDSIGAVTSYVVKVAGDTEARVGELREKATNSATGEATKLSQLPLNAPPNFRRLRSSPGFLPPVVSSGLWTGGMQFAPLAPEELAAWDQEQAEKEKQRKEKQRVSTGRLRKPGAPRAKPVRAKRPARPKRAARGGRKPRTRSKRAK